MDTEMTSTMFSQVRSIMLIVLLGVIAQLGCQTPMKENGTNKKGDALTGPFYEVYLPFWSSQQALRELSKDIYRIRNLYFKTIVISPVQPASQLMVMGDLGSPFAIQNHRQIRPLFGSPEEFKALIDSVHKYDMHIVMDWYPALIGRDHIWKDFGKDEADSLAHNDYNQAFRDVLLLDYTREGILDSMTNVMSYWTREFALDGFRVFDDPSVPTELYQRLNKDLGIHLIHTGYTRDQTDAFRYLAKDEFAMSVRALLQEKLSIKDFGDRCMAICGSKDASRQVHYLGNYLLMSKEGSIPNTLGSSYRSMFILSLAFGGQLLLPGGLELPVVQNMSIYRNQPIKWDSRMDDDFYRQLLILQSRNRSLQPGQEVSTRIIPTDQPSVLAIEKKSGSHKAVIVVNLERSTIGVKFSENIFNLNDFITQRAVSIRSDAAFQIGPYQYYVLTNV